MFPILKVLEMVVNLKLGRIFELMQNISVHEECVYGWYCHLNDQKNANAGSSQQTRIFDYRSDAIDLSLPQFLARITCTIESRS